MLRPFNYVSAAVGAFFAIAVVGSPVAWAKDGDDDRRGGDDRAGEGHKDKLPVYLDRNVHPTAADTCNPAFVWQGEGVPVTTFQRKRNIDAGIELAIKGQIRQGPDIRSTYVDKDGLIHIEVPTGPQVGTLVPNSRAVWSFTFSYDVALKPGNPTLDSYDADLWIDLDPSEKTKFLKLELTKVAPPPVAAPCAEPDRNGYGWKSGNTIVIPDDEGTERVTQNSQNLAFHRTLIDGDPNTPGIQPYNFGPGQFDVIMFIKRKHGGGSDRDRTVLHVVFDVVAAPTQTP